MIVYGYLVPYNMRSENDELEPGMGLKDVCMFEPCLALDRIATSDNLVALSPVTKDETIEYGLVRNVAPVDHRWKL